MLTTRAGICGHENLSPEIRLHAEASIAYFKRHRRFLRFIDTRQKWLLTHLIAMTCHGETHGSVRGAAANWICERACELGIASRNTSLAFFNQLVAYGYLRKNDYRGDLRIKLISLTDAMETALADWARMSVETATGRDASGLDHAALMRIYIDMVTALLANGKWLNAPLDIRTTQDMRGGWLVMSEILRYLPKGATGENWIAAPGLSVPAMTHEFGLSRSTLYRLVRSSVEAGIMAWEERQSVGTLMLNIYHLRQYSRWIGHVLAAASEAGGTAVAMPETTETDLSARFRPGMPEEAAPARATISRF